MGKKKFLCIILCLMCFALVSCSKKEEPSETEKQTAETKENIIEEIGSTPNAETSDKGSDQYIYENTKYLTYTGTSTYYFTDGVVVFSRWESRAANKTDSQKMYKNIVENEEKAFSKKGTQTSNGSSTTCTLSKGEDTATITLDKEKDAYKVTIIKTGKSIQEVEGQEVKK